jgi:hypothetical protein
MPTPQHTPEQPLDSGLNPVLKSQSTTPSSKNIPLTPLVTLEGEAYDIPLEGSLGLLAMGYEGVKLWREKRKQSRDSNDLSTK